MYNWIWNEARKSNWKKKSLNLDKSLITVRIHGGLVLQCNNWCVYKYTNILFGYSNTRNHIAQFINCITTRDSTKAHKSMLFPFYTLNPSTRLTFPRQEIPFWIWTPYLADKRKGREAYISLERHQNTNSNPIKR